MNILHVGGVGGSILGSLLIGILSMAKPLIKKLVIKVIEEEGATIRADLDAAISQKGAAAINDVLNSIDSRLKLALNNILWMPNGIKVRASCFIDNEVAMIKQKLSAELIVSEEVLNEKYDQLENALIARIQLI